MDKKTLLVISIAVVSALILIVYQPIDWSGSGLEMTMGGVTTVSTINYFTATKDYIDPDRHSRDYKVGDLVGNYFGTQSDDNRETFYDMRPALLNKTYFNKPYKCISLASEAMTKFGTVIGISKVSGHDQWYFESNTRTKATISWDSNSVFWDYPLLKSTSCPGGLEEMVDDGIYHLMSGKTLLGISSTCSHSEYPYAINGWADTNIQYVASSENASSIKSLVDSGYFNVVSLTSIVPSTAAEKTACSNSCPLVTQRVDPKRSSGIQKLQRAAKARQEAARAACLSACSTLNMCMYNTNGNISRDSCAKYSQTLLAVNKTIYLYKDATARMYSPTEDFNFFIDMRGGTAATLLCNYAPPTCGDGACNGQEDCSSCSQDCGGCPIVCGDSICDPTENCSSCSQDCDVCSQIIPETRVCTQEQRLCEDGSAMPRGEDCTWLIEDCPPLPDTNTNVTVASYCGDKVCDSNESCSSCEVDCNKCATCSQDIECNSALAAGATLEASGTWSCEANTCKWHEGVADNGSSSAALDDNLLSWGGAILGILLVIGIFYFLIKRSHHGH